MKERVKELENRLLEIEEMPEEPIIEVAKPNKEQPGEEICIRADNAYYGRGEPQSYLKAFRLYKEAVEAGCERAYGSLGRMYEAGQGVERDTHKAYEAFLQGAELKDNVSLFALGKYYEHDIIPKNIKPRGIKVAVEYYLKAKQYGSHDAIAKLAFMYEHGVYFGINKSKALNLYKLGSRLGNGLCKNWLGVHYYEHKEYTRAVRLFSEAKELKSIRAANNLGLCYEQGLGVKRNIEQALNCYEEAAKEEYLPAICNLAYAYLKCGRNAEDYKKAAKWFEIASNENESMPDVLYHLGCLYEKGLGVDKNYEKAFYYYKKAANLDYAKGCKKCGDLLYIEGKALSPNKMDAVQYYIKASELGDTDSYNVLGRLYLNGYEGVKKNIEEAFRCYSEAHKMGCVSGTVNLGIMYLNGIHVKQNTKLAHKLFMEAAKKGNEKAQKYLVDNGVVPKSQFAMKLTPMSNIEEEYVISTIKNYDYNTEIPKKDDLTNKKESETEEIKVENKESLIKSEITESQIDNDLAENKSNELNDKESKADSPKPKSLTEEVSKEKEGDDGEYEYSDNNTPIVSFVISPNKQTPKTDVIKEVNKSYEGENFDDNEVTKQEVNEEKPIVKEEKPVAEKVDSLEEILNEVSDSEVDNNSDESNKTQDLQRVQDLKQDEEEIKDEEVKKEMEVKKEIENLDDSDDFIDFDEVTPK